MSTDLDVVEEINTKLKRPCNWAIILHNDNTTSMEFVIELLMQVFHLAIDDAMTLMMGVHTNGKGVAGIYPYEIAEQKYADANMYIKLAAYQMKISLEKE